jgi:hypothetical protein
MDPVPHTELITNATARKMCGGITRNTFLAWRRAGFPDPLDVDGLELWDRRAVKQWKRENPDTIKLARAIRTGRRKAAG